MKELDRRAFLKGVGFGLVCMLLGLILESCGTVELSWTPAGGRMTSRWAKEVSPKNVLPEHPRPMMVRQKWLNLNGLWDYAITNLDDGTAAHLKCPLHGRGIACCCISGRLTGRRMFLSTVSKSAHTAADTTPLHLTLPMHLT